MKADIHPKYYDDCKVTCVCGNTFTTGSTLAEIRVEVCSKCHPFFTGEMKYMDTLGRVEKFQKRQEKAKTIREQKIQRVAEKEKVRRPESLKEMIELAKKQAAS